MPRLRDSLPVMVCSIFTHGLIGANYREGIIIEFDRISKAHCQKHCWLGSVRLCAFPTSHRNLSNNKISETNYFGGAFVANIMFLRTFFILQLSYSGKTMNYA